MLYLFALNNVNSYYQNSNLKRSWLWIVNFFPQPDGARENMGKKQKFRGYKIPIQIVRIAAESMNKLCSIPLGARPFLLPEQIYLIAITRVDVSILPSPTQTLLTLFPFKRTNKPTYSYCKQLYPPPHH